MSIDWKAAPDMPSMYEPRQELFYKISCDQKRLYVFDESVWKISKHDPKRFFDHQTLIDNPEFQKFINQISTTDINALWLWCKLSIGSMGRLAAWVGVSPAMITGICAGRKELPIERIIAISDYTGIPAKLLRPDIAQIFGINPRPILTIDSNELMGLKELHNRVIGKVRK